MLIWQRPWPRSPPGLREETGLHRLEEDTVRVVSETLQLEACLFSYILKAKPDGYSDALLSRLYSLCSSPLHILRNPLLWHHHHSHIYMEWLEW